MSALNIYPSFQWTTGQTMTAQLLNNPLAAIQAWSTTIDNTNLTGGAGIFASQIVPLNTTQATFGGAVGYTIAPGSTTQVPLTLAGVVGQAVDLFDVTLTPGGIKPFSVASTGAVTALAGASGVTPLTVSGVSGQSSDLFDVTLTSGGTKALSVSSAGALASGAQVSGAQFGDISASRTASTGVLLLGSNGTQQLLFNANFAFIGGALYNAGSGTTSSVGGIAGDIVAQRGASTGLFAAGGVSASGTWDWNIFNATSWSSRNNTTPGYADIFGGVYHNVSDESLKTNVQPITGALSKISALTPVTFDLIATGKPGAGFTAQDVQAQFPDAVRADVDGTLLYAPSVVLAHLVQAFQDYVAAHP